MAESILLKNAKAFAVEIVKLCKSVSAEKNEYVLTKQLLRSGTSIGANIHESKYAQGTADFISKMQIALKECYETEYWLELLESTDYISPETCMKTKHVCGEIRRMLISSINTSKEKLGEAEKTARRSRI
ncbi:MAG: four helix bundle protein [Clostridia bacterium]|nr:four helix bundle protein [Clostridia bacterium]